MSQLRPLEGIELCARSNTEDEARLAFKTMENTIEIQGDLYDSALYSAPTTGSDDASATLNDDDEGLTSAGLFKRDRYIATNRFAVHLKVA